MHSLHNKCRSAIEQRRIAPRCSNAFIGLSFALLVMLNVGAVGAQTTSIRPISKPVAPVVVPSAAPTIIAAPAIAPKAVEAEFRSIGNLPAILYDAPSVKAKKLSILSTLTPLEILARTDRWMKVRDVAGEMGWVETGLLTDRRLVAVTASLAQIRVAAVATEPIAFEAERGVILEMIGATQDGWLAVRHRDGSAGFVMRSQVFGQ